MNGDLGFKLGNIPPELIFLLIGLIYGIAFLFITPPFQVLDEDSHFFKAVGLSEGYVIPEKVGNKSGVYVPEGTLDLVNAFFPKKDVYFKDKLEVNDIISKLNINLGENKKFADLSNTAVVVYSPVPYIISAFAIKIGEFLNLAPLILMYLARFGNLIFWIFLVFVAIRITPIHKWVFLTLALMPMTIFEAASISADSLTIALSFLIIAYILKLAMDTSKFTAKNFFILFIVGLLIASTKSIYILLLFFFLIIPTSKFKNYKMKYGVFFGIFIPIGLLSGFWILLYNGLYVPIFPTWSIFGQISYVIHYPMTYLIILLQTFTDFGMAYLVMFVADLGHFAVNLSTILSLIYIFVLIFVAAIDKERLQFDLKQKMNGFVIFIVTIFVIMTFEYLTWNPVGYNIILGVQGRYFIPIAPLFLLLFYNNLENVLILGKTLPFKMNKYFKWIITGFIVFILSLALLLIISQYYLLN